MSEGEGRGRDCSALQAQSVRIREAWKVSEQSRDERLTDFNTILLECTWARVEAETKWGATPVMQVKRW